MNDSLLKSKYKTCAIHHEHRLYNFRSTLIFFIERKHRKIATLARDGLDLVDCCTGQYHEYATHNKAHIAHASTRPRAIVVEVNLPHAAPASSHHTLVLSTRVLTDISGT